MSKIKVVFRSLLEMRGGRYAAMDFCRGEGVKEGEGRKYSPFSTQFTGK